MSTIGYENWAVDLKDVSAVYPFQGTEVLMVIVAVVLWIGWHLWQLRAEAEDIEYDMKHTDKRKHIMDEVDRY